MITWIEEYGIQERGMDIKKPETEEPAKQSAKEQ